MKTKKSIKKENLSKLEINQYNDWFFLSIFVLTTLIYFSSQLFGSSFFWEDFVEYVYPFQTYAAKSSSNGFIPFWNPYIFSGMPFLADLQVGFFYPFNRVLSFFIDSNGHLSVWGLQFIIILHFLIAQISFYFMMRAKGVSQFASSFSAIAYSFSMMMVCHVFHPMIVYHLAWFPLVFMLFDKSIELGNYKYGIAAGLILGMSMLSGHPQITLYEVFFLGIYYIWQIISNLVQKNNPYIINSAIAGILTIVISVGIFQIQFLTSQELAGLSLRSDLSSDIKTHGSLEYKQILNFVNPHQFGKIVGNPNSETFFEIETANGEKPPYFFYWETAFYFGILTILFGIIGLILTINSNFSKFLLTMIVFSFLYALGSNFILQDIINSLPFFGLFRNPTRMMLFTIFGFSIFAGYGFDKLINSEFINAKKSIFIAVGIVGALIIISLLGDDVSDVARNSALLALVYFVIGAIIIFGLSYKKINYLIAGILAVSIMFLDLYLAGYDFNSSPENPELAYSIDNNMLKSFKDTPNELFRVNTRSYNPPFMATKRNQGMIDEFRSTEGYNPLALQRINPSLNTNDEKYDLLNVKYVLKINPENNQPYFEENFDRMPNAWFVNKTLIISSEEIGEKMKNGNFDFSKEVLLEKNPSISLNTDENIQANIVCKEYSPNYIKYEISNSNENSILVQSEIWYPSWKVFIDGKPSEVYRANYSLRAVEIPKGTKIVEFKFVSELFNIGKWITITTLVLSIVFLFINFNRKK